MEPRDATVVWFLRYMEWLHMYPYAHDQDGFDCFLNHNGTAPYVPSVEEKFDEQIFRVLSEMRGKKTCYNPKKLKNQTKINQNAPKMPSNFKNRPLGWSWQGTEAVCILWIAGSRAAFYSGWWIRWWSIRSADRPFHWHVRLVEDAGYAKAC